jgi:uncharacterized protein (TIGR02466 family)
MSQRMVFPLFSTPVYVNNVGEFDKPDVRSLEYSSTLGEFSYNFLSSVDKNVLHRPAWQGVHALVMQEVNAYARDVLAVTKSIEFYVTNSWINIHTRGQAAGPHVHHNSLISGVLYLKVGETTGDLLFYRNDLSLVPFPPALDLDMDSFNIYNCKTWSYRPKTNDICLFPSVVLHSADFNRSDEERWCLAFNVFVKGEFGRIHQLNLR